MTKQINTDTPPVSSKQFSADTPPVLKTRIIRIIEPYKTVGGKYICSYDRCPYKTMTSENNYYCPFKGCIYENK